VVALLRYKLTQFKNTVSERGFATAVSVGGTAFFNLIFEPLKRKFIDELLFNSYAGLGEDREIERRLGYSPRFYVDVGANDPVKGSLTFRFYKQGGQGIIIEPNLEFRERIGRLRPRDLHLAVGLASTEGELTYYRFEQNVLNTFSREQVEHQLKNGVKIVEEVKMPVCTLAGVLSEHGHTRTLDLLTIDAEGFDLDILQSNNWEKFRPKMILIEHFGNAAIDQFLEAVGYNLVKYFYQYGRIANGLYQDRNSAQAEFPQDLKPKKDSAGKHKP
jgi:FkbM family methyltransferase